MRLVISLLIGMALGTSLGVLSAPQRGRENIRVIREWIQLGGRLALARWYVRYLQEESQRGEDSESQ